MAAGLKGLDKWSGSTRSVMIEADGPHVLLTVEATSGANRGEALLTPEQARAVAAGLQQHAEQAENESTLERET